MLYLQCYLKNCFNVKIETLKHCENLFKAAMKENNMKKIRQFNRVFEQVFQI